MEHESPIWKLFTKKAEFLATCNTCQNDYSFRASIGNLKKHWDRKHGGHLANFPSVFDSDVSDEEGEKATAQTDKKSKAIWNNFTISDSDKYEATCKICDKTVSFEFMLELSQHLRDHGEEFQDSEDEVFVPDVQKKTSKRKRNSYLWNYFKVTDNKMAECLLCKKILNYASTISNLRKHLQRVHKDVKLNTSIGKRIYLNGELYEIASDKEDEETDNKVEHMEMDPIYLSSDSMDKQTPCPKKNQSKIPLKRRYSKISEEQVHSTKNTCSEEHDVPRKDIPSYTPNAMGSIDYFGQYVVSLLKDLPKAVSDSLQSEIIKQIFASKMALDSETGATTYEIKIYQNDKHVENAVEPVSYTAVQTNEAAEKINDAAEELLKVTDVWSYFDVDSSGKKAQCVPCKTTVDNEYEVLKAHLKDNHPKLLLQILQNKDDDLEVASNDGDTDNENIFTEVVYLDPEPTENGTRKEKPKSYSKNIRKRERKPSTCNSDVSPKKVKKDDENDELTTFIKYITCLLKKLPSDVFSNVQIDIINTILRANSQANTRSIILSKEQVNTCSNIITVDGISPMPSSMVGHNYTITVAPPKESEGENS